MNWRFYRFHKKPLRMIWKVQKNAAPSSYLVGTAHFFPFSFKRSINRLLNEIDLVLTEGPLDESSMRRIAEHGRDGNGGVDLGKLLEPDSKRAINSLLAKCISEQDGHDLLYLFQRGAPDYFEMFSREVRPWMAFFSIWTTCLGWSYSVDQEAYNTAVKMGKRVQPLETLNEQLTVLDGIPIERLVRHLNDVNHWHTYQKEYIQLYLDGNLEGLVSLTNRFPTRTPTAIGSRDRLMFNRMEPLFENQPTAAFIGFPHIPGVIQLFLENGYTLAQEIR